MFCVKTKGQSTLEYVILLGFIVSALIAMDIYMKRGMQGRLRQSTDQVGEQYAASHFESDYSTNTMMLSTENRLSSGVITTGIATNWQEKTGNETVAGFQVGE